MFWICSAFEIMVGSGRKTPERPYKRKVGGSSPAPPADACHCMEQRFAFRSQMALIPQARL